MDQIRRQLLQSQNYPTDIKRSESKEDSMTVLGLNKYNCMKFTFSSEFISDECAFNRSYARTPNVWSFQDEINPIQKSFASVF